MNDNKLQITISHSIKSKLKKAAEQISITPNILARMHLCMIYGSDEEKKTRLISLKIWDEIEEYAELRGYGIEKLLEIAIEYYMKKNHLTPRQKERFDRKLEERNKMQASAPAVGL